jgi:hypothetical protein
MEEEMTIDDLEEKLGGNKLVYGSVPMDVMCELSERVNVMLEMDTATMDYFYRVSVDELMESGAPIRLLDELRDEGWAFDSSRKNIELYLK